MGSLYLSSTTAPGNTGVLANTSTSHPGSISGNVIYVDVGSLYLGSTSWVIHGFLLLLAYLTLGGVSSLGNSGLPTHVTQLNPGVSPNFQQPFYQTMTYKPNIPPMGMGVPHGPTPDVFFSRTPAYVTPNPRVDGEMNERVRGDQIARTLKEFVFTPKGWARSYQKPYPEYFDMIPYPWGFWVLDLAKFTGDDAKTTYEHIGHFFGTS
jgi:hypothetical protein